MKLAIATAIAALSLAGAAFADTKLTATLEPGQTGPSHQFIAATAVWNCAGDTCTSSTAPDESASITGCQDFVHEVGPVSAFGGDFKKLDLKSLKRCNAWAKPPAAIKAAAR